MNFQPIYAVVIAALALVADRALAAQPQMPEPLQGTWCHDSGTLGFHGWSRYSPGPCPKPDPDRCYDRTSNPGYTYYRAECLIKPDPDPEIEMEITATDVTTEVNNPPVPMSCVVRQVAKFDVCPWGMIYKNRERARTLRSFQINPWGPGYHVVLQCTNSKRSETIRTDWVMEKGMIEVNVPRDYRCPWDRKVAP